MQIVGGIRHLLQHVRDQQGLQPGSSRFLDHILERRWAGVVHRDAIDAALAIWFANANEPRFDEILEALGPVDEITSYPVAAHRWQCHLYRNILTVLFSPVNYGTVAKGDSLAKHDIVAQCSFQLRF